MKTLMNSRAFARLAVVVCVVTLVGTVPAVNAAQLTWTGAGDGTTWDDEANWDGTASTGGVIDTLNLIDEYIVSDPTFNIVLASRLNFVSGGGLTFSDGNLGGAPFQGIGVLQNPDTFGFLNQSGGTIGAQFLAEMNVTLSGDATLNMNGGGNPINNSTVDITSEDVTVNFLAETVPQFNQHLGKFSVNGDPAVIGTNLNVVSDGGSGSIVTMIPPPPALSLRVNTVTGVTEIFNDSGSSIEFDFYKITSPSGSLDEVAWSSFEDQDLPGYPAGDGTGNGWEEAGGSNPTELGEAYLQGTSTMADAASVDLGRVYDTSSPTDPPDVGFRFRDTVNQAFFNGVVVYDDTPPSSLDGDFDDSGAVDQDDLDLTLLNWGQAAPPAWINQRPGGNVGDTQLDLVRVNWGATLPAAASAVPEPGTFGLLCIALVGLGIGRFRRR